MSTTLHIEAERPVMHHIQVCPFSQRVEILMALKGASDALESRPVDITKPREERLLKLTGGTTALPVLELPGDRALKESLVLMDYLEDRFPEPAIRRSDPYERGLESLLVTLAGPMIGAGYRLILNQDREKTEELKEAYFKAIAEVEKFLQMHGSKEEPWLFDRFGWAEAAFTPFFKRFVIIPYYEGFDVPEDGRFDRFLQWRAACMAHPAAQQVTDEQIIKVYYDYAVGVGNGSVPEGRLRSSFVADPPWQVRPMPPRAKYEMHTTDAALGLVPEDRDRKSQRRPRSA